MSKRNVSDTIEEARRLSKLGEHLLRHLEPETEYSERLVEDEVAGLIAQGEWKEITQEGSPWIKSLERKKFVLRIAIIHARRGEHITGADLVFELKGRKVVFVQSKRVGSNGRVHFDRLQLLKLAELEAQVNLGTGAVPLGTRSMTFPCLFVPLRKAAFYHLIMLDQGQTQERFFHISEIEYTLGNRKSTSQDEFLNMGLTQEEYDTMFWNCTIGAPDMEENAKKKMLYEYSLITGRTVAWLHVEERPGTT